MSLTYIKSLGLCIEKINVEAQNIDESILRIYAIVLAIFSLNDKLGQV